jgi:uncharacterized protein YkwD
MVVAHRPPRSSGPAARRGRPWSRATLALGVACVVVAAVAVAASRAVASVAASSAADGASGRPAQIWNDHIFMPLAGRLMRRTDLEPVGTAVPPTRTRGPSPTPTSTRTPGPTDTPEPTPTPTAKPISAEENSPDLVFTGAWRRVADAKASGGAYNASATKGDTLKVTFAGPHVAIYRMLAPDGGMASIDIDGVSYPDVTFYFFERRYQVPAVIDNLPAGGHTLTLTVTDRKAQASSGTNVTIDAVRGPSPFEANEVQQRALDRSNWYRDTAQLPVLRLDRAIDLSAQAHSEYDKVHSESHYETQGKAGFTGARFWERLAYFGYGAGLGEVMYWATSLTAESSVDGWMATVYHRLPFMDHGSTDIGYGETKGARFYGSVIDFGARDHVAPSTREIYTYPVRGQREVPYSWNGNEAPNPLPGATWPVGYPASMHIVQPARALSNVVPWTWDDLGFGSPGAQPTAWKLTTSRLTDGAGTQVQAYVLDQASDSPKLLGPDVVFVIGKSQLKYNTTYTVRLVGTDSRDQPFDHSWSFTTGQDRPAPGSDAATGYAR